MKKIQYLDLGTIYLPYALLHNITVDIQANCPTSFWVKLDSKYIIDSQTGTELDVPITGDCQGYIRFGWLTIK